MDFVEGILVYHKVFQDESFAQQANNPFDKEFVSPYKVSFSKERGPS